MHHAAALQVTILSISMSAEEVADDRRHLDCLVERARCLLQLATWKYTKFGNNLKKKLTGIDKMHENERRPIDHGLAGGFAKIANAQKFDDILMIARFFRVNVRRLQIIELEKVPRLQSTHPSAAM